MGLTCPRKQCICNRKRRNRNQSNREFIKRHLKNSEALPSQASVFTDKKRGFQALAKLVRGIMKGSQP